MSRTEEFIGGKSTIKVVLNQTSTEEHTYYIYTGLKFLEEQGKIQLTVNDCRNQVGMPEVKERISQVIINGKMTYFDVEDGYCYTPEQMENYRKYLLEAEFCFRRSYSEVENEKHFAAMKDKIYPLGFNYLVTYKGNPFCVDNRPLYKKLISRVMGFKPGNSLTCDYFEKKADYKEKGLKIMFTTRLWEPPKEFHGWDNDNEKISNDRILIIRELKKRYGTSFIGGVSNSSYAQRVCPELILPKRYTRRETYLKSMQNSDICIGSMGLSKSSGWKTGEYIAAARAVINEKIYFDVPGDFEEGKNYLAFTNVDECVAQVEKLMNHPELVYQMKQANENYYKQYLRPDMQMWHAIQIVLGK